MQHVMQHASGDVGGWHKDKLNVVMETADNWNREHVNQRSFHWFRHDKGVKGS